MKVTPNDVHYQKSDYGGIDDYIDNEMMYFNRDIATELSYYVKFIVKADMNIKSICDVIKFAYEFGRETMYKEKQQPEDVEI